MNVQIFTVPDTLKPYVRYFWSMESDTKEEAGKKFRTMADGCPGIIYQQTETGTFYQDGKELSEAFLFGQTTKHAELSISGNFNAVGIYFQPHAINAVFGFNPESLTNTCMDINLMVNWRKNQLSEQLQNTQKIEPKIDLLSTFLLSEIKDNNNQNNLSIEFALTEILKSNGTTSLKYLQEKLQVSERSFERKFKQLVGISPRLFSRICRFQASLKLLKNNNYNKLSDIAFENDYADQSHFIRSFKEFAGFSPYRYQKQSNEIVENFSELL